MPLYQNESSCLLYEDELNLHENEPVGGNIFIQMVSTKVDFDSKAKGNSEH